MTTFKNNFWWKAYGSEKAILAAHEERQRITQKWLSGLLKCSEKDQRSVMALLAARYPLAYADTQIFRVGDGPEDHVYCKDGPTPTSRTAEAVVIGIFNSLNIPIPHD